MLDNSKQQQNNTLERRRRIEAEEDSMGFSYMPYHSMGSLNEYKGVFANDDETSLNTAKSVFDRTAIFHVKQDD